MIDAGEFDYVIAGGGTAGCVVAARLSEDPDVTRLPDRGRARPTSTTRAILRLEDWMYLLDSGYDWDYLIEPQAQGQQLPAPRPREGARRLLVAQLVHRVLDAEGGSRRVGRDGVRGLELGGVLAADQAAGDQRRARRPPRARRPGEHPHGAARRSVRRRAARGGRPGGAADEPLQRGPHGDQRGGLVPDQLVGRQHADVVLARVPASDPGLAAEPRDPDRVLGQAGGHRRTGARPRSST